MKGLVFSQPHSQELVECPYTSVLRQASSHKTNLASLLALPFSLAKASLEGPACKWDGLDARLIALMARSQGPCNWWWNFPTKPGSCVSQFAGSIRTWGILLYFLSICGTQSAWELRFDLSIIYMDIPYSNQYTCPWPRPAFLSPALDSQKGNMWPASMMSPKSFGSFLCEWEDRFNILPLTLNVRKCGFFPKTKFGGPPHIPKNDLLHIQHSKIGRNLGLSILYTIFFHQQNKISSLSTYGFQTTQLNNRN